MLLEHGGSLALAAQKYGIARAAWLDLSTGISPRMYPVPDLPTQIWQRLPEESAELLQAACAYYGAAQMLAVAGSQAAISTLPRLIKQVLQAQHGPAKVLMAAPSYAEHEHHWRLAGHTVELQSYANLAQSMASADYDVLLLVNPNNPTGEMIGRADLLAWSQQLAQRGGYLIIDEAFVDCRPEMSVLADQPQHENLIVLRSIGKFFGLAGLRLGFVAAAAPILQALAAMLGPWTISTAAQIIASAALQDRAWQTEQRAYLRSSGERLQRLLAQHQISSQGTDLFQWWRCDVAQAQQWHAFFAARGIFSRLFTDQRSGIRLGLPADETQWQQLEQALAQRKASIDSAGSAGSESGSRHPHTS